MAWGNPKYLHELLAEFKEPVLVMSFSLSLWSRAFASALACSRRSNLSQ